MELLIGVRPNMLWRLKKTVYGLKQSNKEWIELVQKIVKDAVFNATGMKKTFCMKTVRGRRMFCLVCIDNILIAVKKKACIDWLLRAKNKDWIKT